MHIRILALPLVVLGLLAGPRASGAGPSPFQLSSPAFPHAGGIPAVYTCDGEDRSPPLQWTGAPDGTKGYTLIMDDPDAPGGTFTHWVLFNIPATRSDLAEGFRPGQVGTSGRNSFGRLGYGGPCPPSGTHRYFFTLHALDVQSLSLPEAAGRVDVERAMNGHIIGRAQLMGTYARRR